MFMYCFYRVIYPDILFEIIFISIAIKNKCLLFTEQCAIVGNCFEAILIYNIKIDLKYNSAQTNCLKNYYWILYLISTIISRLL